MGNSMVTLKLYTHLLALFLGNYFVTFDPLILRNDSELSVFFLDMASHIINFPSFIHNH